MARWRRLFLSTRKHVSLAPAQSGLDIALETSGTIPSSALEGLVPEDTESFLREGRVVGLCWAN